MSLRCCWLLSIVGLLLPIYAAAQPSSPADRSVLIGLAESSHKKDMEYAIVRTVSLADDNAISDSAFVQVIGKNGVSMEGLDSSDFKVNTRERGAARITKVTPTTSASGLDLTFILDNSASMFHAYDSLTKYLDILLNGLGAQHSWDKSTRYSAIVFDNLPRTPRHLTTREHDLYVAPFVFTESPTAVQHFWHYYDTIRTNFTPLYDAIAEGLDPSEDLDPELDSGYKHILIVVSDGEDNASRITLNDLTGLMEHRAIRLFAVNFRSEPDMRLKWLARHSNGTYYYAENLNELRETLLSFRKSLFSGYMIHYQFLPVGAGGQH